jgi:hypothetical protein
MTTIHIENNRKKHVPADIQSTLDFFFRMIKNDVRNRFSTAFRERKNCTKSGQHLGSTRSIYKYLFSREKPGQVMDTGCG